MIPLVWSMRVIVSCDEVVLWSVKQKIREGLTRMQRSRCWQRQSEFRTGLALDHIGFAVHGARELAHEGEADTSAERVARQLVAGAIEQRKDFAHLGFF